MLNLNIRRRVKRRLPDRVKEPLSIPEKLNESWSMDFLSDNLMDGRRFRILNVIDDYNCESLAIESIELKFIQPGKPVQNAFVERNNGSLRRELLDAYLFYSLALEYH